MRQRKNARFQIVRLRSFGMKGIYGPVQKSKKENEDGMKKN